MGGVLLKANTGMGERGKGLTSEKLLGERATILFLARVGQKKKRRACLGAQNIPPNLKKGKITGYSMQKKGGKTLRKLEIAGEETSSRWGSVALHE